MNRIVRTAACAVGVATVLGLATACSVVNTAPDQKALHYSGGSFSSQKYQDAVGPGTRKVNGAGDHYYYYPEGQRTYDFTGGKDSDHAPFHSATTDPLTVTVAGTMTFHLDTSTQEYTDSAGKKWPGGKLQKFHETIGNKKWGGQVAYSTEGNTEPGEGWDAMLDRYLGQQIGLAIDNVTLKYKWAELYSTVETKTAWTKEVTDAIPALVKAQAGEDFFIIDNITLSKPDIPDSLKSDLAAKQSAILRANTAAIDEKNAETFPGGLQAYLDYQQRLAVIKAINEGKVQVIPVPAGTGITVQVPPK